MLRYYLLSLILFQSLISSGQGISGKWEGSFDGSLGMVRIEKIEMEIEVKQDTIVTGKSHLYYRGGGQEDYILKGSFDVRDSTVYLVEDSSIGRNRGRPANTCKGIYLMQLFLKDSILHFEGRWKDNSATPSLVSCPSTRVFLKKISEPPKPVVKVKAVDPNLKRPVTIQKLIEIGQDERDSIKVELLDNFQVDNDVVSVYLNDAIVLSKQKLAATPVVFYLSLDNNSEVHTIKMAAESMGSIPPCTALMIVSTKKNRYSITLSSDFGNNGVLQLALKK